MRLPRLPRRDLSFIFQGETFHRRRFITSAEAQKIDRLLEDGRPSGSKIVRALAIIVEPEDRSAFREAACDASVAKLASSLPHLIKMRPRLKVRR